MRMLKTVEGAFPDVKYQCCTVHFYRKVFSVVLRSEVKLAAKMFKPVHAKESRKAAWEKVKVKKGSVNYFV